MSEQAVTFRALQVEFARLWHNGNILPESVTISEADYTPFAESIICPRVYSDFERELLGAERIAELERYQDTSRNITHIINYVDGGMVRLIRDKNLPAGTLSVGYRPAETEWKINLQEGER